MAESTQQPEFKITLEDILRLKRREKPSAEFWDRFDRELRQKTLRALVDEEPWHRRWLRPLLGQWRIAMPLAAAAVFAMVFSIFQDGITFSGPQAQPVMAEKEGAAHVVVAQNNSASMPVSYAGQDSSFYTAGQTRFFINIISMPSSQQETFDKVMTPQTLTAATNNDAVYVADPLRIEDPSVQFVSAPALDYF